MLQVGDRVVYVGALSSLVGRAGRLAGYRVRGSDRCYVFFDRDDPARERVVDKSNIISEQEYHDMKNFKTAVKTALDALLKPLDADSGKEQAVRRLGVASELVKRGESDKKAAKKELKDLGIISDTEEAGTVFDSDRYIMTASVRAASSRLDAAALDKALEAERISSAARRRIVAAATVTNKAAVSYTVETK